MSADELLATLTLDQKLAQLGCQWITAFVTDGVFDEAKARQLLRYGIGQITRIGASTGLEPEESAELMNAIQRIAIELSGIPVIVHEESTGGYCAHGATVFPQGLGLAATWDPALVEHVASAIGEEMRAVGARHTLAPVLDVARDPRWGRVEETYGEDPVLCGTIGTAYVKGIQQQGVAATGKHFLGYAMSEGGRNHGPVHLGPRELREVYAEPFAAAIRDAGLATIMNSYSSVDGLPCAGSHEILTGLLRDELGFDGPVVADYFSVDLLRRHHHVAADKQEAAVTALAAGLDLELPATDCFGDPLKQAIEAGRVDEAIIDRAARRVLQLKERLGLFDDPYVDAGRAPAEFDTPAHRALARTAATESIVLLRNDGDLLPLDPRTTIALIGPGADDPRLLQGDYHYPAHAEISFARQANDLPTGGGAFNPGPYYTDHVTPRRAIETRAPITYAAGAPVTGDPGPDDIATAVDAATNADVAVVIAAGRSGLLPECTVGEARDATDLSLTGAQTTLIDAITATGTPTVLVIMSGRVHTIPDGPQAILYVPPPGEEGGNALADVLFGDASPSGRLPVTIPRTVGQVPLHSGHRAGGTKSQFWGDYTDSPATPAYPFGHGLTYTTFDYTPPTATPTPPTATPTATPAATTITTTVTNAGQRRATEVVQLYVTDVHATVARPERQLVGFARVDLQPQETKTATFMVHPSRLAFYDEHMDFVTQRGTFRFEVGGHSVDVDLPTTTHHRQRDVVATVVEVV